MVSRFVQSHCIAAGSEWPSQSCPTDPGSQWMWPSTCPVGPAVAKVVGLLQLETIPHHLKAQIKSQCLTNTEEWNRIGEQLPMIQALTKISYSCSSWWQNWSIVVRGKNELNLFQQFCGSASLFLRYKSSVHPWRTADRPQRSIILQRLKKAIWKLHSIFLNLYVLL